MKRGRLPGCEMRCRRSCRVGRVRPGAALAGAGRDRPRDRRLERACGRRRGRRAPVRAARRPLRALHRVRDDEAGRSAVRRLAELGIDTHVQYPESSPSTRRAWTHVDARRRADDHGARRQAAAVRPAASRRLRPRLLRLGRCGGSALRAECALRRDDDARAAVAARGRRSYRPDGRQRERSARAVTTARSTSAWSCRPTARTAASRTASASTRPSRPALIVDTYGAGDSFAAALAFALARGDALAGRAEARGPRGRGGADGARPVHLAASFDE